MSKVFDSNILIYHLNDKLDADDFKGIDGLELVNLFALQETP